MATMLYDIYTISIKGKSWREKLAVLNNEADSYALLTAQHISFASTDGVSYADMVIDDLALASFIYVEAVNDTDVYLLIYLDAEILFSGLLSLKQLKAKLLLYKSRLHEMDSCYVSGAVELSWFEKEIKATEGRLSDRHDCRDYRLQTVAKAKAVLKRPLYRSVQLAAAAILVVITGVGYHKYKVSQALLQQEQATQKSIDLWAGYRAAVKGSAIDVELAQVFNAINQSTLLGDTAVKSFAYQKGQLTLVLASFNHPIENIQQWSVVHGFKLSAIKQSTLTLDKSLTVPLVSSKDNIMNAEDVQVYLLDQLHAEGDLLKVDYDAVLPHENYRLITGKFTAQGISIAELEQKMHQLHDLPLRLDSIKGYISDGQFTGLIRFRLVGGLS